MTEVSLEKRNFELQQQLNKENEQYYGNLLIYVRVKTVIRDNQVAEEMLLEILQDILEAQSKGIAAEDYFGKNPKQIADELIQNLPINFFDTLKLVLIGTGSYLLFTFFPAMLSPEKGIDLGKYLVGAFYTAGLVVLIFWLLGQTVYRYKSKLSQRLFFAVGFLGFIGGVAVLSLVKTSFVITLSKPVGISLILLLSGIAILLFIKEEDKKIWAPFIPPVLIFAIGGILVRLSAFEHVLETEVGKITVATSLIIAMVIQNVMMFFIFRKDKQN